MNRQDLESRLTRDAGRLRAASPPSVRQRVAGEIRRRPSQDSPPPMRGDTGILAGAFGALAVLLSAWLMWQSPASDPDARRSAGLNVAPVVTSSDRLLASREAALETEWRSLERDLGQLRAHVMATLDIDPGQ